MKPATALIAEDEPLLAANLQAELARLWPELSIVATVGHGEAALQQGLKLQPDVMFLDIRMPGMTGLEAAQALAEDWPDATNATNATDATDASAPFPLIVFVTAYDQYALQAFERAAFDYVLKPVQTERLAQTCGRLQAALKARSQGESQSSSAPALGAAIDQLRSLLAGSSGLQTQPKAAPLRVIQASVGAAIHMVPVDEVLYFEAADKYVRVITNEREHLIRLSLRELLPQLDTHRFWQIHRSTVVRSDAIASALRDEAGKVTLTLRGHKDKLAVSRLYAHLFKAL
jgi:DNA-binding LytR/AlgR family response regulator